MKDPLGVLINTDDPEQAEAAMRALKSRFSGPDIIAMAREAGWLVWKKSELVKFLMEPGYTPLEDDDE